MALYALGATPSKDDLNKLIQEFSKDKSDKIDFSEFLKIMISKMAEKDQNSEIEKAFDLFDINKDGKIDFDDLKQVARELNETMTDEELYEMLAAQSSSGSGKDGKDSKGGDREGKEVKYEVTLKDFQIILSKNSNS